MNFRQPSMGFAYVHTRQTQAIRLGPQQQQTSKKKPPRIPPRFSVVICTYNRRNMVLTTLASLRKQTLAHHHFEVLIIDNGSTDGTFNAIQTYLCASTPTLMGQQEEWQARCVIEPQNGLVYARSTGIKEASGEIIVFLDDDTIADPHFLENLQQAYDETQADAIGGCVEIRWEAQRPHWLADDMLDMLGYYVPFRSRTELPATLNFSASCFSVKREVLLKVGNAPAFLSKRLNMPIHVEIVELCRRLRQAGYTLWYDPRSSVSHRIPRARLERAFFVGRAYWQGRSEILAQYADIEHYPDAEGSSIKAALHSILPELKTLLHIALIRRPLLRLAHKSTNEQLRAAITQARCWGRLQQQFMLSNHAPAITHSPAILIVQTHTHDAIPLALGFKALGIHCRTSVTNIPLAWIWRYRAHQDQAIGIIHFYRPGAIRLNHWQRQRLLCQLWLAQTLGIRVVCTDAGGWWQSIPNLQFLPRRTFERHIFSCSEIIHTYTRHTEQVYLDRKLRRRVCYLPHPGLKGTIPILPERHYAYNQLGLPEQTNFVYLCFADMHTEREVIQLIEAFSAMQTRLLQKQETIHIEPVLLLIGTPRDKKRPAQMLQRAALNTALHIFLEHRHSDLPLYIGAANALVMPYATNNRAGLPELAILAYSYERVVITPELPRFRHLLPPQAQVFYQSSHHASLVQGLTTALKQTYHHTEEEALQLEALPSWRDYAGHLLESYRPLLAHPS
ncbi:MAG TPA: glycosyltransferase [Dictyobacter sp.]|nr:glycosyltransferase [Dictyobacter sp.]